MITITKQMERNMRDLSLREFLMFVEQNNGHLKGRGDGTVKWEVNDDA